MPLIMGIDTGGTYTDGVIIEPSGKKVLCKAKALTTKNNLIDGIGTCIDSLNVNDIKKVKLVCLSTTLATNAVIEGKGGRVGLLLIGGEPEVKPPVVYSQLIKGKLDIKGKVTDTIDENEVYGAIKNLKKHNAQSVAVSGYASVRNPVQELKVKKIIRKNSDIPIVCAHELTSSLGFKDRTVTAVLNARLIPIVSELIRSIKEVLNKKKINAHIMVVKGDGSLMQESFALDKPIETILSGPAASVIGGIFLTNQKDALIVDMGGTTTDIAEVQNGVVKIRKDGANVGGWLTKLRAAKIYTFGIGGDSHIHLRQDKKLSIGPHKVKPLCVAGKNYPNLIQELKTLKHQGMFPGQETDCFAYLKRPENGSLSEQDEKIVELLKDGPHSLLYIAKMLKKVVALPRLVNMGVIEKISITPTDILHVMGLYNQWDEKISLAGVEILKCGQTVQEFTKSIYNAIINRLALHCMQSVTNNRIDLNQTGVARDGAALQEKLQTKIDLPVIAIGAPAPAFLPAVGKKLNTKVIIPEHAEVANAIGAAVGQVMQTVEVLIRPEKKQKGYILHSQWERTAFDTLEEAKKYTIPKIIRYASKLLNTAGSKKYKIIVSHEDIYTIDKKTYIETKIKATGIGSPMWIE